MRLILKISPSVLLFVFILSAQNVWGQGAAPKRPGDTLPELPSFEAPQKEKILPDIPLPLSPDTEGLSGGIQVFVRSYRILGNTVLSQAEIDEITAPYTNKKVSLSELEILRDKITSLYIERGYINSGAVIPDQDVSDGIFDFQIIEGQLSDIDIETDGRFRKRYFETRLKRESDGPLNIIELENRLRVLQLDDRIQRIEAQLAPAETRGDAILKALVRERKPFRVGLAIDNHQPPSVGGMRGQIALTHDNVLGYGDRANAVFEVSEGLNVVEGVYAVPLNSYDTLLDVHVRRSWSRVIEDPFKPLKIRSTALDVGSTLTQPIIRSANNNLALFLTGEYRRTKTFLLGSPFSFSLGPDDGVSKVAVIRLGQDYSHRTSNQVFAARSTFSFGVHALGATDNKKSIPDGEFFSWLVQTQWAHRLPFLDMQVILRADAQLTDSPLLGLEQFAVGGNFSVRGYRENQLVNDNGTTGSIEIRLPVWQQGNRNSFIDLAVFTDVGHSWAHNRSTLGQQTLLSAGVGTRAGYKKKAFLQFYWGYAARSVPDSTDYDIQDTGVHLRLSTVIDTFN